MAENDNNPETFTVPLRHRILGRLPSVYAHNLIIQTLPNESVLSFFETILPPKPEQKPEDIKQLEQDGLVAECVSRITVSHQAFLDMADAFGRVAAQMRSQAQKGE